MAQNAIFPILKTWQSQGMNGSTSHKGIKAIDFGVLLPYKDTELKAPFDGTIVYVDAVSRGHGIAFQSNEPVRFADGRVDYMTLWTGHSNDNHKVGDSYKQGQVYSHMGTAGNVDTHCHLETQVGKFKMATKTTSQGSYAFENMIEPNKALFVTDNHLIKYCDLTWVKEPKTVGTPVERNENVYQIQVKEETTQLRARKEPSLKGSILGFTTVGIYNVLDVKEADGYKWYNIEQDTWIAYSEDWEILLPKTKSEIDELKEQIEKLNAQIEVLNQKNEELNKEIVDKKDRLSQINKLSS